jgi:hypothetical protein
MGSPEIGIAVVCAGFVGFFVLLFGTLALMRWFRHKERLAMIEQGLMPPDAARPRNGKAMLAWGIGITAFGLAVLCGASPLIWKAASDPYVSITSAIPALLPGLVILFMGVALMIIYFVTRPEPGEEAVEGIPPLTEGDELPALERGDEGAAEE